MSVLCAYAVANTSAQKASEPAELKRISDHIPERTDVKIGDPGTTESDIPEFKVSSCKDDVRHS